MTIHTLDLQYLGDPEAIASYIIMAPDGPVMIETGPGSTVENLKAGLKTLGLTPGDVRHTLVTHIHFDHAGAAGWMASQGSQVYVHEFGAKHLIDPSRLISSAKRIYKEDMDRLWGEILSIPESQVTAVHGGDVLELNGLPITAIETPGHARHHHAFSAEIDGESICFTGDSAACYIKGCDYVAVPMPPPEFDLEAWIASIEKLESKRFDAIYPTHFNRCDEPAKHLGAAKDALREHAEFVRMMIDEGVALEEMYPRYGEWYVNEAKAAGMPAERMGFYVKNSVAAMNVTGIHRYWTQRMEKVG